VDRVTGIITTVAGTGVAGFSGDNGAATSARLALPSAVAVDASGSLYIADTNNHRIRKVATNGTITTVAGNGEELFAGDGGAATSASLDSPTGVAVDAAGKIYIADRQNHRIRVVGTNGIITTIAGSGGASFAGGFGGDGASATAATLAKPSGVSVDASGNVYIADTDNHRIRQVSNGAIATMAGSGEQGFAGDNDSATRAVLNAPRNVTADSTGNIAFADRLNQRVRSVVPSGLSFGPQAVGSVSTTQTVTLGNSGNRDQNIHGAKCLQRFRHQGLDIFFNGDIAAQSQGFSAGSLNISYNRFQRLQRAAGDHNIGAIDCQPLCDCLPQGSRAARYDGHFVCEAKHVSNVVQVNARFHRITAFRRILPIIDM
jgi:hypothetical protein